MYLLKNLLPLNLQFFAAEDDGGFPSIEQFANVYINDDEPDIPLEETVEETQTENSDEEENGESEEITDETPIEGEETPDPFRSVKHKVKIDGQESEVDYDELVNGYSRQSDYTKKMQDLAEQRKQYDELGDVNQLKEWVNFQNELQNSPEFAQYMAQAIDHFNQNIAPTIQPQTPRFDASKDPYVKQLEERLAKFEETTKTDQKNQAWTSFVEKHPDANNQKSEIDSLMEKKPGLDFEDAFFLLNRENLLKQKEEEIVQNNMKKKVAKTQNKQQSVGSKSETPTGTLDGALAAILGSSNLFSDD